MSSIPRPDKRQQILIVEDNEDLRRVLVDVLQFEGFTISSAASGEEALDVLAQANACPDLVLTDLLLDGMTGCALLAELRASNRWRSVPVILLSGHIPLDDECGDPDQQPDAIVEKPFDVAELVNTIRNTIEAGPQQ